MTNKCLSYECDKCRLSIPHRSGEAKSQSSLTPSILCSMKKCPHCDVVILHSLNPKLRDEVYVHDKNSSTITGDGQMETSFINKRKLSQIKDDNTQDKITVLDNKEVKKRTNDDTGTSNGDSNNKPTQSTSKRLECSKVVRQYAYSFYIIVSALILIGLYILLCIWFHVSFMSKKENATTSIEPVNSMVKQLLPGPMINHLPEEKIEKSDIEGLVQHHNVTDDTNTIDKKM